MNATLQRRSSTLSKESVLLKSKGRSLRKSGTSLPDEELSASDFIAAFKDLNLTSDARQTVAASHLAPAFSQLGLDVKVEEIERMVRDHTHGHTDITQEQFVKMMSGAAEKIKFFADTRLSSKDWVVDSIRSMAHFFKKVPMLKGQILWQQSTGDASIILIMRGTCSLVGKIGKVELPICELGRGALVGKEFCPASSSKVVATSGVVLLVAKSEDIRQRLGDKFILELGVNGEDKERWFKQRVTEYKQVFRTTATQGLQLPFSVQARPKPKATLSEFVDIGALRPKTQKTLQGRMRSASAEIRSDSPMSLVGANTMDQSTMSVAEFLDNLHVPSSAAAKPRSSTAKTPGPAKTAKKDAFKPFSRKTITSSIPRIIPKAEYHVRIDTSTMMYDAP